MAVESPTNPDFRIAPSVYHTFMHCHSTRFCIWKKKGSATTTSTHALPAAAMAWSPGMTVKAAWSRARADASTCADGNRSTDRICMDAAAAPRAAGHLHVPDQTVRAAAVTARCVARCMPAHSDGGTTRAAENKSVTPACTHTHTHTHTHTFTFTCVQHLRGHHECSK